MQTRFPSFVLAIAAIATGLRRSAEPQRAQNEPTISHRPVSSRYINNRLASSTVTDGIKTVTLVQNYYDQGFSPCFSTTITDVPNVREHDSSYGTLASPTEAI
jgi:hypothetical protein